MDKDQYADGKVAKAWNFYLSKKQKKTEEFRTWLLQLLQERGCKTVLDVACGPGVDSIMLLEEGFEVVSTDLSYTMLKFAFQERWTRRKDPVFEKWVIQESNMLTMREDLRNVPGVPHEGFDAVICIGNTLAHLPNSDGKDVKQKLALENMRDMVKPGGILIIDHRNFEEIIATGQVPCQNIYYDNKHNTDMKCLNSFVNGVPVLTTMTYTSDLSALWKDAPKKMQPINGDCTHSFTLSFYPILLNKFKELINIVFGEQAKHDVLGNFQPLGKVSNPIYYIHVIQKLHVNNTKLSSENV